MRHAIIIPCYNESKRLDLSTFMKFAESNPDAILCFVNDGSADQTRGTLAEIKDHVHENVFVYHIEDNGGKADAVRQGALFLHRETDADTIGFLDADLSTSFEEYQSLLNEIEQNKDNLSIVFGSRNIGGEENNISRSPLRKLFSDVVKILILFITKLKIADTQCGAKVFHRDLIPMIYTRTFFSRWLFDVEILLRLKKKLGVQGFRKAFMEKPLKEWIHMDGSKITLKDSIMIPKNLLEIWYQYEVKPVFEKILNKSFNI